MPLLPLLDIFDIGQTLIERLIPDPAQKAQAQLDLLKLQQNGQLQEMNAELQVQLQQIAVDKIEASLSGYKGAWRPTVGYVCVLGLLYQFFVQPLMSWASGIAHWPVPPQLDMSSLVTLLGGLLGLSGMRTVEKLQVKS